MADKIVMFLQMPLDKPFDPVFYMCGGCGRVFKFRDCAEHARLEHNATGVNVVSKEELYARKGR